jgi:hypothetical protein
MGDCESFWKDGSKQGQEGRSLREMRRWSVVVEARTRGERGDGGGKRFLTSSKLSQLSTLNGLSFVRQSFPGIRHDDGLASSESLR